jgi:hypothetical protein
VSPLYNHQGLRARRTQLDTLCALTGGAGVHELLCRAQPGHEMGPLFVIREAVGCDRTDERCKVRLIILTAASPHLVDEGEVEVPIWIAFL